GCDALPARRDAHARGAVSRHLTSTWNWGKNPFIRSQLGTYLFSQIDATSGVGAAQWQAFTLKRLFAPCASSEKPSQIAEIVERILMAKNADSAADTSALEMKIDAFVYRLYGLTDEEIAIVEMP
ncbi:MAG: hypothetical protein ACI4RD_08035, partial [Kiritimatiellia bacterium]